MLMHLMIFFATINSATFYIATTGFYDQSLEWNDPRYAKPKLFKPFLDQLTKIILSVHPNIKIEVHHHERYENGFPADDHESEFMGPFTKRRIDFYHDKPHVIIDGAALFKWTKDGHLQLHEQYDKSDMQLLGEPLGLDHIYPPGSYDFNQYLKDLPFQLKVLSIGFDRLDDAQSRAEEIFIQIDENLKVKTPEEHAFEIFSNVILLKNPMNEFYPATHSGEKDFKRPRVKTWTLKWVEMARKLGKDPQPPDEGSKLDLSDIWPWPFAYVFQFESERHFAENVWDLWASKKGPYGHHEFTKDEREAMITKVLVEEIAGDKHNPKDTGLFGCPRRKNGEIAPCAIQ